MTILTDSLAQLQLIDDRHIQWSSLVAYRKPGGWYGLVKCVRWPLSQRRARNVRREVLLSLVAFNL